MQTSEQSRYHYGDPRDKYYYEFSHGARLVTSPLFGLGELFGTLMAKPNRARRRYFSRKEFYKTHSDETRLHRIIGHGLLLGGAAYTLANYAYIAMKGQTLLSAVVGMLVASAAVATAVHIVQVVSLVAALCFGVAWLANLGKSVTAFRAGWKEGLNGKSREPMPQPVPA